MPISRNRWVTLNTEGAEEPAPDVEEEPPLFVPTGATRPQLSVPQPDHADRLPQWNISGILPDYWWLGVHGGAGESSLARLNRGTRAAEHHWPVAPSGSTVVLVARSNISGLQAAQKAATEWGSHSLPLNLRVAGLVVIADAPGRIPKEIRDFAHVVGGGVPYLWHFPWIEAWRFGHNVPLEELSKEARAVLDQVRIAATTIAGLPAN